MVQLFLLLLQLELEVADGLALLRDLQGKQGLKGPVPLIAHVSILPGEEIDDFLELLVYAFHLL